MKKLIFMFFSLLVILLPIKANAVIYKIWWDNPTEREPHCLKKDTKNACIEWSVPEKITVDEIKEFRVYYTNEYGGELLKTFDIWGTDKGRSYMFWWEAVAKEFCIVMTTVDTDDRESLYSCKVCFITGDPKATEIQCK